MGEHLPIFIPIASAHWMSCVQIGGTAPMWTGKNAINPLAAICAGAMMPETLGEKKAADRTEKNRAEGHREGH